MVGTPPAPLDDALVTRLAQLARIALSPEERAQLAQELARIVAYVDQLAELPLEGVPPLASPSGPLDSPWRRDDAVPSLPREVALAEAPRARDGGFAVPGFVDEG